jgi:beta-glucanase (GH16 family)
MPKNEQRRHSRVVVASIFVVLAIVVAAALANVDLWHRSSNPSGQAMPRGDLPGWRQVFTDDFTTDVRLGRFPAAVSDKWAAYDDGWPDTSRNGKYLPSRVVSVHDGMMDLHVRTDGGTHMVAAPLPRTAGPGPQGGLLYGRYVVRFRADAIPGYKVAWLLWPDSENWADGEINFPEGSLTGTVAGFVHYKGEPTKQKAFPVPAFFTSWHTAAIEWRPGEVAFFLDGLPVGTFRSRAEVPDTPMHWVLQTETNLEGRRPAATAQGHVQIDWVAVYSLEH